MNLYLVGFMVREGSESHEDKEIHVISDGNKKKIESVGYM